MSSSLLPLRRCSSMTTTTTTRAAAALRLKPQIQPQQQQLLHQYNNTQFRMMGHSVRIIATENLPTGKCSKFEVVSVKAGYARNYLIPQKMAVYATRKNFDRLGLTDPHVDAQLESLLGIIGSDGTVQATTGKALEKGSPEEQDFKAAELLKHYLRNKVLKIWRSIQAGDASGRLHPGMVDARAVRQKLSKQLRIDLEPHEKVHLFAEPLGKLLTSTTTTTTTTTGTTTADDEDDESNKYVNQDSNKKKKDAAALSEEEELNALLRKTIAKDDENVQIRHVGDYLARISLRGGHVIPLKVAVLKR